VAKKEPPGGGSGVNREASNRAAENRSDPEDWIALIMQGIG
jgi:hypothetical protein